MAATGEGVANVKKTKRTTLIRHDDSRPTKPSAPEKRAEEAAEVPTYEGARKTDEMPRRRRAKSEPVKAQFEPQERSRARAGDEGDRREQKPRRRRRGASEQYVRLRVRYRNGRLSVVDSHLVDGPLGQVTGFPGSNAYEVTLDGRLLHAGALPDLGVQRSFANPQGPPEQHGHYLTDRDVYEFTARLPADQITPETIGKITIRLLRVKEEAQAKRLGDVPLSTQFERQLRPVAELTGLPKSVLPEAIEERGARTPTL